MQLRIKAMYGKIMSRLITIFWMLEVIAVLALGIASLVAIDGKRACRFLPCALQTDSDSLCHIANFSSGPLQARKCKDVQSDVFTSLCVLFLGSRNYL